TALGMAANGSVRRPINAWINGDHDHPQEVRDALLVASERMAMRGALLGSPIMLFITAPVIAHLAGFTAIGYIAVEFMGMIALAIAAFLMGHALELRNRPLMIEVAAAMPADVLPAIRTWGLRSAF